MTRMNSMPAAVKTIGAVTTVCSSRLETRLYKNQPNKRSDSSHGSPAARRTGDGGRAPACASVARQTARRSETPGEPVRAARQAPVRAAQRVSARAAWGREHRPQPVAGRSEPVAPVGQRPPHRDVSSEVTGRTPRSRRTASGGEGPVLDCVLLLLDGLEVVDEPTEHVLDHGLAGRATPPISPKRAPQMGISRLPWADDHPPSIAAVISATGRSPSCRCAIRVRSAGGGWSADAAGPSPRPCGPWQALQCRTNTYGASRMVSLGTVEGCYAAARAIPRRIHPTITIPRR